MNLSRVVFERALVLAKSMRVFIAQIGCWLCWGRKAKEIWSKCKYKVRLFVISGFWSINRLASFGINTLSFFSSSFALRTATIVIKLMTNVRPVHAQCERLYFAISPLRVKSKQKWNWFHSTGFRFWFWLWFTFEVYFIFEAFYDVFRHNDRYISYYLCATGWKEMKLHFWHFSCQFIKRNTSPHDFTSRTATTDARRRQRHGLHRRCCFRRHRRSYKANHYFSNEIMCIYFHGSSTSFHLIFFSFIRSKLLSTTTSYNKPMGRKRNVKKCVVNSNTYVSCLLILLSVSFIYLFHGASAQCVCCCTCSVLLYTRDPIDIAFRWYSKSCLWKVASRLNTFVDIKSNTYTLGIFATQTPHATQLKSNGLVSESSGFDFSVYSQIQESKMFIGLVISFQHKSLFQWFIDCTHCVRVRIYFFLLLQLKLNWYLVFMQTCWNAQTHYATLFRIRLNVQLTRQD